MMITQCFVHSYKQQLNAKGVRKLDEYYDGISTQLKARFTQVMIMHVDSLKLAVPIFLGSIDWRTPHYVTRRCAEFIASLLTLNSQYSIALNNLDIEGPMKSLRVEMIHLMERMGATYAGDKKILFLINNYALIVTLVKEHSVSSVDTEHIEKLLDTEAEKYGEGQLIKYFSKLLTFVRAHSVKDKSGKVTITQPTCDAKTIEEILRSFTGDNYWKDSIDKIYTAGIMQNFPNFITGRMIFSKILTILYTHYSMLSDIITQHYKDLKSNKYYIPISEMRYKIKELTPPDD